MNEYINNFHSLSPTKMVSWLLLPHLPNGGFLSSYPFCNAQLFINPNPNPETAFFQKKTNANPDHTFYWPPFKFVHFFMHTHPTPLLIPTLRCFWAYFALWCIWNCLLSSASYIMMSGAISVCHFNCVRLEKYCHLREGTFFICTHPPPPPPSPSSLRVSFWKVGPKCNLDPSDISFKIKVMHQVLTKN